MASFAQLDQIQAYLPQTTDAASGVLEDCLTRATDIVRYAMRARLADPLFDYAEWGAASSKIVRGYGGGYLTLPAHQDGSITLVEYQGGSNPVSYTALPDQWIAEGGLLYRASGWGWDWPRYRITAIWGYGPDVPSAIEELTLELAVNIWRQKDAGMFQTTIGADGGGSLRYVGGLNKQQEMIIASVCQTLWEPAI